MLVFEPSSPEQRVHSSPRFLWYYERACAQQRRPDHRLERL